MQEFDKKFLKKIFRPAANMRPIASVYNSYNSPISYHNYCSYNSYISYTTAPATSRRGAAAL